MGVANRDKDSSEQMYALDFKKNSLTVTGATVFAAAVPFPGQLRQSVLGAAGISGAPTYQVQIHRWIPGAGNTVISPGAAMEVAANYGVSGGLVGQTYASNSSLAAVVTGDMLVLKSGVADTASLQVFASFVVQATQDIKKTFSIS